jgi:hypothetical protein
MVVAMLLGAAGRSLRRTESCRAGFSDVPDPGPGADRRAGPVGATRTAGSPAFSCSRR